MNSEDRSPTKEIRRLQDELQRCHHEIARLKSLDRERQHVEEQLRTSKSQLRQLSVESAMAGERDRRRLAEALHDSVGQNLSVALLRLSALAESFEDPHQIETAKILHAMLIDAVASTRQITSDLSSAVLQKLGLVEALRELARQVHDRDELSVRVEVRGADVGFDDVTKVILYRAVRELLANVVRHARVSEANVLIEQSQSQSQVAITVSDPGVGLRRSGDPLADFGGDGFGLRNIEERVKQIGGTFEVGSKAGRGTSIRLCVPLVT